MEKLIYVLVDTEGSAADVLADLRERVLPEARRVGGSNVTILVPDQLGEIQERAPARVGGEFARLGGVFEVWMRSLDDRGPLEESLRARCGALWGYLVTESVPVPCPHRVAEGERVPGVTQWTILSKPAEVAMDDFHREWVVHSKISFDLHPRRESYDRNAVARRLTPEAPDRNGIVLERFPGLDVFTNDEIYFGDPAVVQEMIEHLPKFYDFATASTGAFSEYRFG